MSEGSSLSPIRGGDASETGDDTPVLDLLPEQIEATEPRPANDVFDLAPAMEVHPTPATVAPPPDPFVRIKHGARRSEPSAETLEEGPPPMPRIVTTGWRSVIVTAPAELEAQLRTARNCADEAARSQDRTNASLYRAISAAYDLALLAREAPDFFAQLLADNGLAVQQRAPMTPIVKLVFGPTYDKTRIAEYAATLEHAARNGVRQGALDGLLQRTPGGVKALVQSTRMRRLVDSGKERRVRTRPRDSIVRTLRVMPRHGFDEIAPQGDEFALVLIRRSPGNGVEVIGEVPRNVSLIEKAAGEILRETE
ncbi:MAG: hypothetical protein JSR28_18420 [Proteobacteria bacterium]|nr:hypothetical protein [Pseudomonadota bacterium]